MFPRGALLAALAAWGAACAVESPRPRAAEAPHAGARRAMVQSQMAQRDIVDPAVLAAMERVARHRFVPAELRALVHEDRPLPIGEDQTISQPYIVAYMTQALELRPGERVLEIGTGSGYQAAVLAELGTAVYTIEIIEGLGRRAGALLDSLGYKDIRRRLGDGYFGWPEAAPFDAIILTAAPDHIPEALVGQLAEGGRMVLPVGGRRQELVLLRRLDGAITRQRLLPVRFVPMTGAAQQ